MGKVDKRCILAYTSMYIEPDGKVRPCCVSGDFEEELNFNDFDTIEQMYNSKQMKELRKSMEDGQPLSMCDVCYKGGHNLMPHWNKVWKHKLSNPDLSDEQHNVKSLDYLDARFSSLCNFKCRMCGPGLSTTWEEDYVAVHGQEGENFLKYRKTINPDPISKFTAKDLQNIEHLNVGGGEPFITADFWKLLDSFSDEQKSEITMYVNTNGSVISYKGENVLDKLAKFKEVVIGVSCDGYGKIGEYQRTGFKQDRFDKNFTEMVEFSKLNKNVITTLEYTITTMNIFHIQDFIYYVKDKWPSIGYHATHMHWATSPTYFAPVLAPEKLKNKIINYIIEIQYNERKDGYSYYIDTPKEYKSQYSISIDDSLQQFLDHMLYSDTDAIRNWAPNRHTGDAKYFIEKLDELRGENWKEVIPHMEDIIHTKI